MSLALNNTVPLRFLRAPARGWQWLNAALARAAAAHRLRREIDAMDDHILADIGISRAQARFDIETWGRNGH